ncbi:mitochondrial coenzyme A transporter SLC25A42 [Thrips palmi]|uniref:Mitochondrial coenzyme A transporter SLC25A42 n=1 Tax=Thrips palmi TaxID=161013 RepID=A0A6P8YI11_THRPL|nr:mitochondrial coenzyme A transporter SLC25A42 [Thrips palmi]XP_034233593.1 mitochondrial coenzyme A transporter SLC25A42 [Thrips palmi]XP_034233594.1 mitochondrial coenzyme A transporter SLC25A42 [Thrips palmi]XP_034233595.1 mitochondrial coenzyme A transporter SLC25A42 [Thrips palmi]
MVDLSYSSSPAHSVSATVTSITTSIARKPPPASTLTAITSHGSSSMNDKPVDNPAGVQEDKHKQKKLSWSRQVCSGLIAGGAAGAVAKTTIAPLDRAKIYFQIQKTPYSLSGVMKFLKGTYYNEGVLGLWRGNSATMARIIPHGAIQFTAHEQWVEILGLNVSSPDDNPAEINFKRFLAGALAGTTSQTLTYPLDLARARMAVTNKQNYDSLRAVFRVMWQNESALAFYRGYLPTLLGVIPYAGLSFYTYQTLKKNYGDWLQDKMPTLFANWTCGAIAGAVSQTGSYPFDIVRRRMQTAAVTGEQYDSFIGSMRKIYREEGIRRGFYKGLSMNWIKGPLAVGISFACNEFVRDNLRKVL